MTTMSELTLKQVMDGIEAMRRVQEYLAQLKGAGLEAEDPGETHALQMGLRAITEWSRVLVRARTKIID
jgi:hypothetical protein